LLTVCLTITAVLSGSCGGQPSPTAPSSPTTPISRIATSEGVRLEIFAVNASRWAVSGAYIYDVRYGVTNSVGRRLTYQVSSYSVRGPDGAPFAVTARSDYLEPKTLEPTLSGTQWLTVDDVNAANPFGERLRLTVSFRFDNGSSGTVTAEDIILHGPQTARVHEFTVSPKEVPVGGQVTVRWRVESASRVQLESTIGSSYNEFVEEQGTRTFTATRAGAASVILRLDNGAFVRFESVSVR
jgi:hypothetical protein